MGGTQRSLLAGLVMAFALATALGFYLNRTEWVVLVSQADPRDAAAIVTRLQELKVPYRPVGDGYTITVPKAEQYTAKLALAQAGLPRGTSVGFELFDEIKFGATDFDRRVNYLRAQQGELERALMRISGVEHVSVRLAIPERTVFVREQQPVTAAVMVQTQAGRKLTTDQVLGIVSFVAGSVQGLSPDNVQIVDHNGRLLSTGLNPSPGLDGGEGDPHQRQMVLQREMELRIQSLLEPLFGPGNAVARVNLELTAGNSRVESQVMENGAPKTTEVVRESTAGLSPRANSPGTDPSPIYQGQEGGQTGSGDYWMSRTTTTYELSHRRETSVVPAGSLKRVTVGIAVNRPDLLPEQVLMIKETVAGATGAELAAISVAAMPFAEGEKGSVIPIETSEVSGIGWMIGGAVAAIAVLVLGLFMTVRRRGAQSQVMPMVTPGTTLGAAGSALDVALGNSPEAHQATGLREAHIKGPDTSDPLSQQLALAMAGRPKRGLTLPVRPAVDEELTRVTDELINANPEASAEVLKQWLKGGN